MRSKKSQTDLLKTLILVILVVFAIFSVGYAAVGKMKIAFEKSKCAVSVFQAAVTKVGTGKPMTKLNCDRDEKTFEKETDDEANKYIADKLDEASNDVADGRLDFTTDSWIAQHSNEDICIVVSIFDFKGEAKKKYSPMSLYNYLQTHKMRRVGKMYSDFINEILEKSVKDEAELYFNINYERPIDADEKYILFIHRATDAFFQKIIPSFTVRIWPSQLYLTTDLQGFQIMTGIELIPIDEYPQYCDVVMN